MSIHSLKSPFNLQMLISLGKGFFFVMENNGKDKENAWKMISLSKNWNKNSIDKEVINDLLEKFFKS